MLADSAIREQFSGVIVGQQPLLGHHVLIEGVPGLGKTRIVVAPRSTVLTAFLAICILRGGLLFAQPPRIDSVTPGEGPIAGGTAVVLRGANLAGAKFTIDASLATATVTADEIRFITAR